MPAISKAFYLKICLQVLISESFTMSKLVQKCNFWVAKNGENLVDADLLILAKNFAITNILDQSSYG